MRDENGRDPRHLLCYDNRVVYWGTIQFSWSQYSTGGCGQELHVGAIKSFQRINIWNFDLYSVVIVVYDGCSSFITELFLTYE